MDHIFQPFVQGNIEICSGIYLSHLTIRTTLIHLEIKNIPHTWCVQTAKLWIQATGLKIVFCTPWKVPSACTSKLLTENCKALGHSRVVEKGGNGLKQGGFHPGSLTGNMSHIYTWRIFELPQTSWPKSSCISLTTCFSLPFQALVPPEVNYHQWHWGTIQASHPDPSQLSHITPAWLVLMLHSPSISLLRGWSDTETGFPVNN